MPLLHLVPQPTKEDERLQKEPKSPRDTLRPLENWMAKLDNAKSRISQSSTLIAMIVTIPCRLLQRPPFAGSRGIAALSMAGVHTK